MDVKIENLIEINIKPNVIILILAKGAIISINQTYEIAYMKRISTLLLLLLTVFLGFSQEQRTLCGYDHQIATMAAEDPNFMDAYNQHLDKMRSIGENSTQRNAVLTIPVVIHIVWHTNRPEENLDDSVIIDQMRVLNEAYRFNNPDKVNLRDTFSSIVDDAMIEFTLAGIVRKETSANFGFNQTDRAKHDWSGGSKAWDTKRYLNIWVFKLPSLLGGQLLGMAYPPPFLPNWPFPTNLGAPSESVDGVIVDFRVFGSNNPNPFGSYDARGRTSVHEVGHYLGLRHIWGDGSCGADDGAKDTPRANANSNSFNDPCDPNRNVCHNEANDGQPDRPDMWENYMDYSTESCQVALTKDQITIIRGALEGPRAMLLSPPTAINLTQNKEFGIHPNPVYNGVARIYANEKPNSIEVFDLVGQRVYFNDNVNNGQEISFDGFQKGIYLITASFDEGQATQKVILK